MAEEIDYTVSNPDQINEISHSIYRYINLNNTWVHFDTINCATQSSPVVFQPTQASTLVLNITRKEKFNDIIALDIGAALRDSTGDKALNSKDFFSWEWYIDNQNNKTAAVSAITLTETKVDTIYGTTNPALAVNNIRLLIKPNTFTDTPTLSTLYIVGYQYNESTTRSAITSYNIIDQPDQSEYNVNFTIAENNIIIGSSDLKTLTRNKDPLELTFTPYTYTKPQIEGYKLAWVVDDGITVTVYNDKILNLKVPPTDTTTVTLCSISAYSLSWGDYFHTQKSIIINRTEINNSPSFIVYPRYGWIPEYTELTQDTYTLLQAPTAYGHKNNLSEEFIVNATPGYDVYYWKVGEYFQRSTSNISVLNIPYSAGLYKETGAIIYLTAFNALYPEDNNTIYYQTANSSGVYPITACSKLIAEDVFETPPRIIPYDPVIFEYDLNLFNIDFNSSTNKLITTQTLTFDNTYSPVSIVSGEIIYTLATDLWTVQKTVTAVDGAYDLFCITTGDASIPLSVDPTRVTNLTLSACAYVYTAIKDYQNRWSSVSSVVCFTPIPPEERFNI